MITPEEIKLTKDKKNLILTYFGNQHPLDAEFLRVYSPSAEVRGHGVGEEVLQTGKKDVEILGIEMVGQYALKITFDDGHDSGLFTWQYLYSLAMDKNNLWQEYLARLTESGASREAEKTDE